MEYIKVTERAGGVGSRKSARMTHEECCYFCHHQEGRKSESHQESHCYWKYMARIMNSVQKAAVTDASGFTRKLQQQRSRCPMVYFSMILKLGTGCWNQGYQKTQCFLQCYSQKKLQRIKKHGLFIQLILLTGKQEIISRTLDVRVFGECNICFPAFPQRKTHEGDVKKAPQSIVTRSIPAGVPSNKAAQN